MKNEVNKIKKEIISYLNTINEDTYLDNYYLNKVKKEMNKTNKKEIKSKENNKEKKLNDLKEIVSSCKKCSLGLSRLNSVFGSGSHNAEIMFVGEGPGYQEDHKGEPFIGRAGQLLDKILLAMNLNRKDIYIANIVKCHPMINPEDPEKKGNDRPPTAEEISKCRFYLEEQIKIIKPKIIVTLGNVPTRFFLNDVKGITQLRGKIYDLENDLFSFDFPIKILPTYHPAALLRNPNLKKDTWEDMKNLMKFLGIKLNK